MTLIIRFLLLFLSFLTSCGYHHGQGGVVCGYSTISVPYIQCDIDGDLTAAVIREVDKSGVLRYVRSGGNLQLCIKIIEISDENIGFRYDRVKKRKKTYTPDSGETEEEVSEKIKETHSVIPTETRRKMLVELSVQDSRSCTMILGPTRLVTSVDFDHDYFSSTAGINVFSLGQLTDIEAAEDAVLEPLNDKMAKKIVDYVCGSW